MGRPIKRLAAAADVVRELRRRSRSPTIGVRDRERAEIIVQRLDGVGVEAVAAVLHTTPRRVSMWSRRFERSGLAGPADSGGSRPVFRDDLAHHSDLISLGIPG